jgi:hypothetical protein
MSCYNLLNRQNSFQRCPFQITVTHNEINLGLNFRSLAISERIKSNSMKMSPFSEAANRLPTYGTRRFITVFTRALHWSLSWAR